MSTDVSYKRKMKEFGFKPYGKTKGKFKITYNVYGIPQTEIWESMEMAISAAKRYSKTDEFSDVKIFDESNKQIMEKMYAKGGMMAKGGKIENQYEGKTAKEVWEIWSYNQRLHFLKDNKVVIMETYGVKMSISINQMSYNSWDSLPNGLQHAIENHIAMGQYAKGGKVKKRARFSDKVDSIADRLDGTKVPNKYREEYGGRYSRDEAEESARRIAGAKLRDEAKPKKRKRFEEGGDTDDNFEIVVISKETSELHYSYAGRLIKDRFFISAENEQEAKNKAVEMWEKDMDNSNLYIFSVLTDSEYRLWNRTSEATQQLFRDNYLSSLKDGDYMAKGGSVKRFVEMKGNKPVYALADAIYHFSVGTMNEKGFPVTTGTSKVFRIGSGLKKIKEYMDNPDYNILEEKKDNKGIWHITFVEKSPSYMNGKETKYVVSFDRDDLYADGGMMADGGDDYEDYDGDTTQEETYAYTEIYYNPNPKKIGTKHSFLQPYVVDIDGKVYSMSGTIGKNSVIQLEGWIDEYNSDEIKSFGEKIYYSDAPEELISQIRKVKESD